MHFSRYVIVHIHAMHTGCRTSIHRQEENVAVLITSDLYEFGGSAPGRAVAVRSALASHRGEHAAQQAVSFTFFSLLEPSIPDSTKQQMECLMVGSDFFSNSLACNSQTQTLM